MNNIEEIGDILEYAHENPYLCYCAYKVNKSKYNDDIELAIYTSLKKSFDGYNNLKKKTIINSENALFLELYFFD